VSLLYSTGEGVTADLAPAVPRPQDGAETECFSGVQGAESSVGKKSQDIPVNHFKNCFEHWLRR
jgi:hypothetical protein